MDKNQMKIAGIVCLVISVVCIFIAVERYNTNANNVRAMKHMMNNNSSPLGGMMNQMTGGVQIKAKTPAATKYAILFAVITAASGTILLVKSSTADYNEQIV